MSNVRSEKIKSSAQLLLYFNKFFLHSSNANCRNCIWIIYAIRWSWLSISLNIQINSIFWPRDEKNPSFIIAKNAWGVDWKLVDIVITFKFRFHVVVLSDGQKNVWRTVLWLTIGKHELSMEISLNCCIHTTSINWWPYVIIAWCYDC